jgi:hypothetical protein
MLGLVKTKEASDGHHDPSIERQGGLRRAEIGSRVQNGYVSPGTGGYARPPQERKNRPVSSNKVPARGRATLTRLSLVMKGSPVRVRASASRICRDFLPCSDALVKGSGVHQRSTLVKCSRKIGGFAGISLRDKLARRHPQFASPVTSSQLKSRLTPSAVVKGSTANVRVVWSLDLLLYQALARQPVATGITDLA